MEDIDSYLSSDISSDTSFAVNKAKQNPFSASSTPLIGQRPSGSNVDDSVVDPSSFLSADEFDLKSTVYQSDLVNKIRDSGVDIKMVLRAYEAFKVINSIEDKRITEFASYMNDLDANMLARTRVASKVHPSIDQALEELRTFHGKIEAHTTYSTMPFKFMNSSYYLHLPYDDKLRCVVTASPEHNFSKTPDRVFTDMLMSMAHLFSTSISDRKKQVRTVMRTKLAGYDEKFHDMTLEFSNELMEFIRAYDDIPSLTFSHLQGIMSTIASFLGYKDYFGPTTFKMRDQTKQPMTSAASFHKFMKANINFTIDMKVHTFRVCEIHKFFIAHVNDVKNRAYSLHLSRLLRNNTLFDHYFIKDSVLFHHSTNTGMFSRASAVAVKHDMLGKDVLEHYEEGSLVHYIGVARNGGDTKWAINLGVKTFLLRISYKIPYTQIKLYNKVVMGPFKASVYDHDKGDVIVHEFPVTVLDITTTDLSELPAGMWVSDVMVDVAPNVDKYMETNRHHLRLIAAAAKSGRYFVGKVCSNNMNYKLNSVATGRSHNGEIFVSSYSLLDGEGKYVCPKLDSDIAARFVSPYIKGTRKDNYADTFFFNRCRVITPYYATDLDISRTNCVVVPDTLQLKAIDNSIIALTGDEITEALQQLQKSKVEIIHINKKTFLISQNKAKLARYLPEEAVDQQYNPFV